MAKKDGSAKGGADELAALFPSPRVIPVKVRREGSDPPVFDDDEVTVVEMDIVAAGHALAALKPIREQLSPTSSFLFLAAEHPDEICAAIGAAIRWPAKRVGMLGGASFTKVARAVWEVNAHFFADLLEFLAFGNLAIPSSSNGAGEMPSNTSAAAGTPAQSISH